MKDGSPTFAKIVEGIDKSLAKGITVNLRVVVDRDNIEALPRLARFASKRGWTENPHFKTQIGRNYELHTCQADPGKLYSRVELAEELYNLVLKHPEILEFHRPAFSLSRFLFQRGELPFPLFDACPACKTEWGFDYTGSIYPCTATIGKKEETIGTFYPSVNLEKERIEEWEDRDITVIKECKNCNLGLACGGGCGYMAKKSNGRVHSPDCRPVKELLEMGLSLHFEKGV